MGVNTYDLDRKVKTKIDGIDSKEHDSITFYLQIWHWYTEGGMEKIQAKLQSEK